MLLDFSTIEPRHAYQWLVSTITPRPIAWVSTISADGRPNLAPFSFFQGVTSNPPTLLFSVANTRDGSKKHTLLNIEETGEFVVHMVPYALAEQMNATAAMLERGVSEFEAFGIAPVPSSQVRPPRVAAAPVAYECKLDQIVRVGTGPLAGNVIFGRILLGHVADTVLAPQGHIDPQRLDTIGRMGGEDYCLTRDTFSLSRPDRAPRT